MKLELLRRYTHGPDGRKLGTRFCYLFRGDTQCPYHYRSGDSTLQCALVSGHDGGHRDVYDHQQPAQHEWKRRPFS